jgi:spermidine/putrescine transport system ATP-binding protein
MSQGGAVSERSEYALELEHVTKRFGDKVLAVDDVSFVVRKGEFFSLLGPSGCGKSTTLRMVAGFEEPSEGDIYLSGRRANDMPPFRRDTNMVFQSYALFPHMTVFDNVAFGPRRARTPRDEVTRRVLEALRIVRLEEYADRIPRQLSGGQQQRVGLARALVNRPSVLLLDEPLGALDLKLRQEMQIELKRIQREVGICFLYVTHDQEEALTMSDRIAVMEAGRIEQIDAPEDLYLRPASRYVADFIGKANLVDCTVSGLVEGGFEVVVPGGRTVPVRSASGAGALPPGSAATLVLRPEHMEVLAADPGTACCIAATVIDVIFQGAAQRWELRTGDGRTLLAQTPVRSQGEALRPGDQVWLSWVADQAHLVPGSS